MNVRSRLCNVLESLALPIVLVALTVSSLSLQAAVKPMISVNNAWYGTDSADVAWIKADNIPGIIGSIGGLAKKNVVNTLPQYQPKVVAKLRAVVAKYGFLAIPGDMNKFYGFDPLPGTSKVTAIDITDLRTNTRKIDYRANEGSDFVFPADVDPALSKKALDELKAGIDPAVGVMVYAAGMSQASVGVDYSPQMNKAISQQGDILEQSSSLLWGTAGTSVYFRLGINNNNPMGSGWTKVNGQILQIACSEDGDVWGLKQDGTVAFRKEVSRDNIIGFDWEDVDSKDVAQIAVGADIVLAQGKDNSLNARDGITEGNRKGTAWRQIDQAGSIKHIAISETGRIWAVNNGNQVVIRTGITPDAPLGTAWQVIEGLPEQASKVAVGANSVWVLAGKAPGGNAIYFRFGVSDAKPQGDRWVKVDGGLVDHTVSAQGQLWGTNDAGDIFFRDGIVEGDPIGKAWKGIPGKLNTIAGGHDMRLVLAPKDFIREFGKAASVGVGSKDGECLAWAINATQDKVLSYNQYSPAVNPWVEESILNSTGQALTTPFMGISVSSDGVILLLDGNKKVYRYNWEKKNFDQLKDGEAGAVKFESVSAGNKDALFAADQDTNTLYKYDEATGWKAYQKGNSSYVSAAVDGTVVILNEGGQAQMETAPGSGKWKQLGDLSLDSIAVGSKDIVWGLSETIFYHWINGAWEKVPEKPRDINPDKPVTIANFIPRPAQGMNGLAVNGANTCFVVAVNGDMFHNEEKGVQVVKSTEPTKPGEAPKVEVKPTEPTKETRVQLNKKGRLNIRRSRSTSVSSRRDISKRLTVKKAGKKAGKKAAVKGGLIKPGMDKPAGEKPAIKGAGKKAAEKAGKKPGQKPGKKAARKQATKKVEETITEVNESQEATSEETTETTQTTEAGASQTMVTPSTPSAK